MIKPESFFNFLQKNEINFFTGVPDSLLKSICAFISDNTNKSNNIIAANEGGAIALAAGYHLGTGKLPFVYLQNSGLGNCINPFVSLTDKEVYSIPMIVMIGWRGEPGVQDEPQHTKQGAVTLDLLNVVGIEYFILPDNFEDAKSIMIEVISIAQNNSKPVALIVKKDTFEPYQLKSIKKERYSLTREKAILNIIEIVNDSIIVSTTGMASRELYEIREKLNSGHCRDFLTVGSMGHSNQIALGIATTNPLKKVICIDGDGSLVMHLGSIGIVGNSKVKNFIHIILNNGAHDSVGGQPTVGFDIDICKIAEASGYTNVVSVSKTSSLQNSLRKYLDQNSGPCLVEVKIKQGARKDLGRPLSTPIENKMAFMKFIDSGSCN